MEVYYPLLLGTALFAGFSAEELAGLLPRLSPVVREFPKGEILLMAGYEVHRMGVVLEGCIEAVKTAQDGAQFTMARMGPGGVFGDVLSAGGAQSPVSVTAAAAGKVMWLPVARFFAPQEGRAGPYLKLLGNLVQVMSGKYFALDERVELLLMRGLRRRIAAYLLKAGRGCGNAPFTIPFSRTGLAAYLGCERSALSREISRMAADGLIEVSRATFRIVDEAAMRYNDGEPDPK